MWTYNSDTLEWEMPLPKGTFKHYSGNDGIIYADLGYRSATIRLANDSNGCIVIADFEDWSEYPNGNYLTLHDEKVRSKVEQMIRETLNIPDWFIFTMEEDYEKDDAATFWRRKKYVSYSTILWQLTDKLQLKFNEYRSGKIKATLYRDGEVDKTAKPVT